MTSKARCDNPIVQIDWMVPIPGIIQFNTFEWNPSIYHTPPHAWELRARVVRTTREWGDYSLEDSGVPREYSDTFYLAAIALERVGEPTEEQKKMIETMAMARYPDGVWG